MTGVSVMNFKRGDEPMKAENKRIMITIPPDLEAEIQSLKKEKFYDKPYAEMYIIVQKQFLLKTSLFSKI